MVFDSADAQAKRARIAVLVQKSFTVEIECLGILDLYGAILGKAIYAKRIDLKEAITLCKEA